MTDQEKLTKKRFDWNAVGVKIELTKILLIREMYRSKDNTRFPIRWHEVVYECRSSKCKKKINPEDWKYCPICGEIIKDRYVRGWKHNPNV